MKRLLFSLILLLAFNNFSNAQVPAAEKAALIALYNATDGPNWFGSTNWNTVAIVDTWQGVTVSGGHVVGLDIQGNNLVGTLPTELGDLQWLQTFNLARNKLSGPIPDEIYTILPLETIALHSNRDIDGIISPNVGNLVNLRIYSIHENRVTGPIPVEITTLPSLESLSLYKNNLTGNILPELGNLTTLTALRIGANDYSVGTIPPELGNLTNLHSLWINQSNLTGTLPPELGNLVLLSSFYMDRNSLTGSIPPEYGNFTEAYWFLWYDNQFTGSIPPELGNWTKCRFFYLHSNQLSGPIPPELGNMVAMEQFTLSNNQLTGNIPPEFATLASLVSLGVSNNLLSGALPTVLATLPNIRDLGLDSNQFTGVIPTAYATSSSLRSFNVNDNQLSGTIPDFSSTSSVYRFTFADNEFQFGDFENEFAAYDSGISFFDDNPQAKLDTPLTLNQNTADNVTLTTIIPSGTQLHYTWYKDNVAIAGAPDSPNFNISNLQPADTGIYRCDVTSDIVTDLTLQRHDITLNVSAAPSSNAFITTWKTDNPGTSANNQITIPTTGGGYNYDIDWGDGNVDTNVTGNITHTYITPGTYTVSITGTFPRIYFNNTGDRQKILTIEQWGDTNWSSMHFAFNGCSNLQGNFTDAPDLTNVTSMSSMFQGATSYNADMNNWDVSTITTMNRMFQGASAFNGAIGNWDVINVTDMTMMFSSATAFNQDIGNWNVDNVTNMMWMFQFCQVFNQDIGNWNVANVTNMSRMFAGAYIFNQNIGNWQTGNVTNMENMFSNATAFNQNIDGWNVSSVTTMQRMFYAANTFNQNLNSWNVGNVTNMRSMFQNAIAFNGNIVSWDVGSATLLSSMFDGAPAFNQDIGGWNVVNVQYMGSMFNNATSFDQDLGNWNVASLINAQDMFAGVTLSTANYDALLIGWNAQNLLSNVPFSGGNSLYCAGATARANMISNDIWTIADGGPESPTADSLTNVSECTSYTLPVLSAGNDYYTATNGGGTMLNAGDVISSSQTLFIHTGTNGCSDETSFDITITSGPTADSLSNVSECTSYTLPALSVGNDYYTATNAGGTMLNAGDIINSTQTIFIYTGTSGCSDETSFDVAITGTPTADTLPNVSECTGYTLPILSAGNDYYTATNAGGTMLNAGDVISSSQTIFIYTGTSGCSDETSFDVTITGTPTADGLSNVTECTSYTLPALSAGNDYYTATNAGGTMLNAGDVINSTQTIFIYTGTSGCSDETSFDVTITGNPTADSLSNVTECTSYTLPSLSPNNSYWSNTGGTGTNYNPGDVLTTSTTLYIYANNGGCNDENQFSITINSITADVFPDVVRCTDYVLEPLGPDNYYFTESNMQGTQLLPGESITTDTTIYVYAEASAAMGSCTDQSSFTVTITGFPAPYSLANVQECGSYTLMPLPVNYGYFDQMGGQGTEYFAGDRVENPITLYIYSGQPGCSSETDFNIILNPLPAVDDLDDVETCENYVLPELTFGRYFTQPEGQGDELFANMVIDSSQVIYIFSESGGCSAQTELNITIDPAVCESDGPISCITFPKFFTPNFDGTHDTFRVYSDGNCTIDGVLAVYDRYGKLLKQFDAANDSWDGTFNGQPAPSTDYWYRFVDNESGAEIKGHFALKR